MTLIKFISNLKEILNERIFNNNFSLLNSSLAPIEFDLTINKPFYFKEFKNQTEKFYLKPKSKAKVTQTLF